MFKLGSEFSQWIKFGVLHFNELLVESETCSWTWSAWSELPRHLLGNPLATSLLVEIYLLCCCLEEEEEEEA